MRKIYPSQLKTKILENGNIILENRKDKGESKHIKEFENFKSKKDK